METIQLGGNINLTGFSDREFTEMIVIKKMVGQYARKLSDTVPGFAHLTVTLKDVHHTPEGHGKFSVTAKAGADGHEFSAESVGHNLFVVLDESLKHLLIQMQKAHAKVQH